jgi:Tol biopolymer transport system component
MSQENVEVVRRFLLLERRSALATLYFLVAALLALSLSVPRAESRTSSQGQTFLISREGEPPGTTGRGYAPVISADGRFVAYGDGSAVLVRDLRAGTTVVASRASGSDGAVGDQRFGGYYPPPPSISADGRFVAFASAAQNLVSDDGSQADVFVRDLLTDTTIFASRASGIDGAPANGWSGSPSISADGRFVAFSSSATNLDPADAEGEPPPSVGIEGSDVFVRDLLTGTTMLVSRASGPAGAHGNGPSIWPSISADGRFVAFQSDATNLHAGDADRWSDIYVRDLQTATTIFVGRGPIESRRKGLLEGAGAPSIASDGQSVAFSTFVHFHDKRGPYSKEVVFVRDLQKQTTSRVADGTSPSLSATGRYVAFSSYASDLQPYLTAPFPDVFVHDLQAHRTTLASRAANRFGTPGSGGAHHPSVSADGRYAVFESRASNMHPQDPDRSGDIYLRDLGPRPFEEPPAAFCGGRRATVIVLPGSLSWRFGGTAARDVVAGSRASDRIAGGLGRDRICGQGGVDRLVGGPGRDRINGGTAPDIVKSADNSPDRVDCGPGRDRAIVDPLDRVRRCERVRGRDPGKRR